VEASDGDITSDFGGDFGGGENSDGDVDDGGGSAASTSSSTSSTESTPSPAYHASSVPSSPDTSKQENLAERYNREMEALLSCLACGKNDDTQNTLLSFSPGTLGARKTAGSATRPAMSDAQI